MKINIFLEMINIVSASNLVKLWTIYPWVIRLSSWIWARRPSSRVWIRGLSSRVLIRRPSSRVWIGRPSSRIWIRRPSTRIWIRGPFTRDRDPTGVSSLGDFNVKTSATSVTVTEEVESEDVTSGWKFQST